MADQNQNQGGSKVEKRFNQTKRKLSAFLGVPGGEAGLPTSEPRIPRNQLRGLVDEMFTERREKLGKELKEEGAKAVDSWLAFVKQKKKLEQELKKTTEQEMEKFCNAVDGLFNKVQDFDAEVREYHQQFGGQTQAPEAAGEDDESIHEKDQ